MASFLQAMASDKEVQMIMSLTGVNEETASAAYLRYETTEDAIDALLQKPVTQGDKYLPQKRKLDNGLTPEQEERCKRGRWLQDKVNVVFSVAHSKSLPQQDELLEDQKPSVDSPSVELPVVGSQSRPDDLEQTTPRAQQFLTPR